MASSFLKSSLKSPYSASRNWRNVSFEEEQDSLSKNSVRRSPTEVGAIFTSRDKRDYSRQLQASFADSYIGLSIEEVICDEIDDLLPKTDYTYARTASYSPKHSGEHYISPNMSRRRLRHSQQIFVSDDEDDFQNVAVTSESSRAYSHKEQVRDSKWESSWMGSLISERLGTSAAAAADGRNMTTSTPLTSYSQHHQTAGHASYSPGMLLRSGSRIKSSGSNQGSRMVKNGVRSDHIPSSSRTTSLGEKHKVITVTETTTTTTTSGRKDTVANDEEDERKLRQDESQNEKDWNRQYQLNHLYGLDFEEEISDVDDETRIRSKSTRVVDGSAHVVDGSKRQFSYLSYFSRVTTIIITTIANIISAASSLFMRLGTKTAGGSSRSEKTGDSSRLLTAGDSSRFVTAGDSSRLMTAGDNSSSMSTVAMGTSFLQSMSVLMSWLISRSSAFILWDINMKMKRKRSGCCCQSCWLPLLFLLPLLLLAGYYSRDVPSDMNLFISNSKQTFASSWLPFLWFMSTNSTQHRPESQVDMAHVYQYIQQTVAAAVAAHSSQTSPGLSKEEVEDHVYHYIQQTVAAAVAAHSSQTSPGLSKEEVEDHVYQYIQQTVAAAVAAHSSQTSPGLSKEEVEDHVYQYIQQTVAAHSSQTSPGLSRDKVEAIVQDILTRNITRLAVGTEEKMANLKNLLHTDVRLVQDKIQQLQSQMNMFTQTYQDLTNKLDEAKVSYDGQYSAGRVEWLAMAQALEDKLLNLTRQIDSLSLQSAALMTMLTNCCRNSSEEIRAHVLTVLSQVRADEESKLAGLKAWSDGQFVNKAELDQNLSDMAIKITENLQNIFAQTQEKSYSSNEVKTTVHGGVDELAVRSIVEAALADYSADRVGRPDFALESAGGSVVSVRCSETYYKKTALVSIFGIPLWYTSNSPRTIIQPNVHPGECWAFKGQTGYIVLQLSHPIQPTGFTLEHIPQTLAPKGDISSAPKDFTVLGLISEGDTQGIRLGNYTYDQHGKPIQFFPIQNGHPGIFQLIELRILDNHGNPEYTCVYRFRVHGLP